MSFKVDKDKVSDSGKVIAFIKNGKIEDSGHHTICYIKDRSSETVFEDGGHHAIGYLKSNGTIEDGGHHKVGNIREAKSDFRHPDDRIAAALFILFAA